MKLSVLTLALAAVVATSVEAKRGDGLKGPGGSGRGGACKEAIKETCTECFIDGGKPDRGCIMTCVAEASADVIPQECKDKLSGGGRGPERPDGPGNSTGPRGECKEAIKETCSDCFVEGAKPDSECIVGCVANATVDEISQECKDKVAEKQACKEEIEETCSTCFDGDLSKKERRQCVKECVKDNKDDISEECLKKKGGKGKKGRKGRKDDDDSDNEDGDQEKTEFLSKEKKAANTNT